MIITWTDRPTAATTVDVRCVADVDAELRSTSALIEFHRGLGASHPGAVAALRYLGRRRDALLDARLELAAAELRASWWDLAGHREPAWPRTAGQELAS